MGRPTTLSFHLGHHHALPGSVDVGVKEVIGEDGDGDVEVGADVFYVWG